MNRRPRRGLIAATLLILGAAGCTDTTELPKSTITDTNYFNDPSSYRAFLAKIYAGLAVSGQQGPAGNGDIQGIDEGFSQYLRLLLGAAGAADRRGGDRLGRRRPAGDEHPALGPSNNSFVVVDVLPRLLPGQPGERVPARRPRTRSLPRGTSRRPARPQIQSYRAEARFLRALSYWHGIDLFGNIPLVTEDGSRWAPTPPQQATRAEVYDYVVSELNAIRAELPAASGRDVRPRRPGRRGDAAGQALPERRGVHRHAALRRGAARRHRP